MSEFARGGLLSRTRWLTDFSGEKAKEILLRSKLPGHELSKIWYVNGQALGRQPSADVGQGAVRYHKIGVPVLSGIRSGNVPL